MEVYKISKSHWEKKNMYKLQNILKYFITNIVEVFYSSRNAYKVRLVGGYAA